MFDSNEYREFLLAAIPSARPASGGRFVNCRCFECGDSRDPTHAHMYIAIPENGDVSWAYCHKCKMSCTITPDILSKWGIYDVSIVNKLAEYNKRCFKNPRNKKYMSRQIYFLRNHILTMNRATELKLKYINDRLGTNIDYEEAISKKIVFHLWDLINCNYIQDLTRHESTIQQLNDYFVGFISSDNAFVNMRRLVPEGKVYHTIDKRYIRYNIFDKYDNTEKFYTIPTAVDIGSPNRVRVNISEGEFDILSVYYNLVRDPNQIYMAIGGSGYVGLIRHILVTLKISYIDLHLYPDNDPTGQEELSYVADIVKPYGIPLTIHRNTMLGEKDFGVPPNRIHDAINVISKPQNRHI